jgi:hypothetical protein
MAIKRKILVIVLALCVALWMCVLTGCNENLGFGNYNWQHIHFSDAVSGHCATISSWHDNETGIEVHTKEYGSMFLSEGSYILFESEDCPFCRGGN